MYKISAAVIGISSILAAFPAEAQNHQHRRYEQRPNVRQHVAPAPRYHAVPRYHAAPRHYAPPRYVRPQRNWVPYVVGALGAVAIGSYFYNQYGQVCQRIMVDQEWDGYRYVPVTETVCE
jgi:hypothetical protein